MNKTKVKIGNEIGYVDGYVLENLGDKVTTIYAIVVIGSRIEFIMSSSLKVIK